MKYKVRVAANNLWSIVSENEEMYLTVKKITFKSGLKAMHVGKTSSAGITNYQGHLEFETDEPLVIKDSSLVIE
jgi:hypothetical protein